MGNVAERERLVEAVGLRKTYKVQQRGFRAAQLQAVAGVDLTVARGEVVGLLGESGCGKSTLGRLLVRLEDPTAGVIRFAGREVTSLRGTALRPFRRQAQIIFQNPFEALDPRHSLQTALRDPLIIHRLDRHQERIEAILRRARLEPVSRYLERHPHELSGGQLQRVAIARAMLLEPQFVVADEPVSMLDVSVRVEVLNFLLELQHQHGTAFVFITHDIAAARYVSDRIAVMYLGKIVEEGPAETVVQQPRHPYTSALIASAPEPTPGAAQPIAIAGEPPSPINLPQGCRFADRCPLVQSICREAEPELAPAGERHRVACHLA